MSGYNPKDDGAKMSFADAMSYGDYLHLDAILNAQHPLSDAHDELLFVIQHQTSELWMRLALHELSATRETLKKGEWRPAFKMLARVSRIFEQLNSAWDVLRTMTPSDYTTFRETLGASSGFQSYQYRMIEYVLGNRNTALMQVHAHRADITAMLQAELTQPSLYHIALDHLANATGMALPNHDFNNPHRSQDSIQNAWAEIYRHPDKYWMLYELAEKLMDLEDYFRRWRFNHVTTVERVIGFKRGTGGTSGVQYLRKMLEVELFPELWHVRSQL